jgi:hypothetical protein
MKPIMGILIALLFFGMGSPVPNPGTMPKVGGPGGAQSAKAECPSGEFAIGIFYRCGVYINSIQLYCGKLSGSKVVYTRQTNFAGATGGTTSRGNVCAEGSRPTTETTKYSGAITKIYAHGDLYADYIGNFSCTRFDFAVSPPTLKPGDYYRFDQGCGNVLGGHPVDALCPSGEVLYKVAVKYGLWIDSWQGYCRQL